MGSANSPSLLPALAPLEPLTNASELSTFTSDSTSEPKQQQQPSRQTVEPEPEGSERPSTPHISAPSDQKHEETSPPQSPERPTSMRRFFSRVSLNSSYATNGAHDDKASVFSTPLSLNSPPGPKKGSKKSPSSWWKRAKRHSTFIPPVQENFSGTSTPTQAKSPVQSLAPPPKLPDDMFGANLASMDSDIFKNFK